MSFFKTSNFFQKSRQVSTIPGLDPSDDIKGNVDDISAAGSFHEFLVNLHEKFGPIASFWVGQQFYVSVANSVTFKEIQKLFDRPTILFDFITPLITKKSIQVTNGLEGKDRHRNISEALGHGVCQQIFPQFIQVCMIIEMAVTLKQYVQCLEVAKITIFPTFGCQKFDFFRSFRLSKLYKL